MSREDILNCAAATAVPFFFSSGKATTAAAAGAEASSFKLLPSLLGKAASYATMYPGI